MNTENKQVPPPLPPAVLSEKYDGIPRSVFIPIVAIGSVAIIFFAHNTIIAWFFLLIFQIAVFFRLKNIGRSGWLILISLIPVVGLLVWWPCLYAPTGFAERKKLDTAGKIIRGIILFIMLIGILGLALAVGVPSYHAAKKSMAEKDNPSSRIQNPFPREEKVWIAQLGSGVEMEFMPIAAGSFQMGSNDGDDDEAPVHRVTISKPFWLARTEVTQRQYKQVMGSNPSHFQGMENPVETVSWNDAVSFCKKLTDRERRAGRLPDGFEYALPTEAQWEYACRAGTTSDYAGILDSIAWYSLNSGNKTHSVRTKQANTWGLYDMHGNVLEWCADYCDGSKIIPTDTYRDGAVDPFCRNGSYRINRGAAWYSRGRSCRSSNRYGNSTDYADFSLGFRPVVLRR